MTIGNVTSESISNLTFNLINRQLNTLMQLKAVDRYTGCLKIRDFRIQSVQRCSYEKILFGKNCKFKLISNKLTLVTLHCGAFTIDSSTPTSTPNLKKNTVNCVVQYESTLRKHLKLSSFIIVTLVKEFVWILVQTNKNRFKKN
jgi:hypothetical protein